MFLGVHTLLRCFLCHLHLRSNTNADRCLSSLELGEADDFFLCARLVKKCQHLSWHRLMWRTRHWLQLDACLQIFRGFFGAYSGSVWEPKRSVSKKLNLTTMASEGFYLTTFADIQRGMATQQEALDVISPNPPRMATLRKSRLFIPKAPNHKTTSLRQM